jgi:hypothetical protein
MNIRARFSPLAVAVIVAGGWLGHSRSLADELPKNTNKIERLTVEAAEVLAQRKNASLRLDGLTELSADAATALAQYPGGRLSLKGLTTLSAEAARPLAAHKGQELCLDSLTTLSDEAIQALGLHQGPVSINALLRNEVVARQPLSPQTAKALVLFLQGDLSGITALDSPDSVAIAKALAATKRPLFLPNLKKISPKTLTPAPAGGFLCDGRAREAPGGNPGTPGTKTIPPSVPDDDTQSPGSNPHRMAPGTACNPESPGFRRGLFVEATRVPKSPGWKPGDSGCENHPAVHAG